jgi:hypothetical protein
MKKPKDTVKPMNLEKELCWSEPWEQLNDESDKAYCAFQTYLNLGMGHRTYVAAAEKLGKQRNYEAALRQWASKYQWRARCQAFDAARLEKEREEAEKEKLRIYADGLMCGRYFFKNVGTDLQCQFEGWSPGEPTKDDPSGEQNRTPYVKKNNFTVNDKIRLMTWGYEMAVRNASARKQVLLDQGTKEIEKTAFDEAFDEIIQTDPILHDAYLQLISKALKRSRTIGEKKRRGS